MPLPTLLLKGNLRAHTGLDQAELDEWKPIDYIINWFTDRDHSTGAENRVLVLKSETASGKSTALPPEMYRRLVRGHTRGIICTQPRVATAIENVIEMLKHNADVLRPGETIGWSTKYNKFKPRDVGLLSATIGTLAQILRVSTDADILARYKYIMIDETHERDLQTDMTISMLKGLVQRNASRPDCPFVVLMSATFEPDSLLNYFGVSAQKNFIWCGGQTAPIEEMWDWNDGRIINSYPRAAANVVEKILVDGASDDISSADILIFLPGAAEFKETEAWLRQLNAREADAGRPVFSLLQVDGLAFQTQNRDFMMTVRVPTAEHEVKIGTGIFKPARRVIMATNVAETGLTLENLKYVIDSGYNREIEYNPELGIRALITKPAPVARIRQRRGRAGRKLAGVFYPLYPRYIYDKLPISQYPQILTEDVSVIYLDIMAEQLRGKSLAGDRDPEFDPNAVDMVDPPTPDAASACLAKLYGLGFISPFAPMWNGGAAADPMLISASDQDSSTGHRRLGITHLGLIARIFNGISPESARMILSAYYWGASVLDVVSIAAYLTVEPKTFVGEIATKSGATAKSNIDWLKVYRVGLPSWAHVGLVSLYKIRVIIADDFIHGVILFNAVRATLASGALKSSLTALKKWCGECGISVRACLDFVRARDDIINQMLTGGLDVFGQESYALDKCAQASFTDTIARLKYCIYDGYRDNILVWKDTARVGGAPYLGKNPRGSSSTHYSTGSKPARAPKPQPIPSYFTRAGVPVITPKIFREDEKTRAGDYEFVIGAKPRVCIYRSLSLKYNRATFAFDVNANDICVLDGYVSVDLGWM